MAKIIRYAHPMLRAFTKLTMVDWIVVISGLWLVLFLQLNAPTVHQTRAEFTYANWSADAEGFAAFAKGDGDAFGWVWNRNTMQAAENDAMAHCAASGTGCQIIERLDRAVRHPAFEKPVSPLVVRSFEKYGKLKGFKAFAMTDAGTFGYWPGAPDPATARANALKTCESYKKKRSGYLPDLPCFVVDETF